MYNLFYRRLFRDYSFGSVTNNLCGIKEGRVTLDITEAAWQRSVAVTLTNFKQYVFSPYLALNTASDTQTRRLILFSRVTAVC